jgi:hypothetical protein
MPDVEKCFANNSDYWRINDVQFPSRASTQREFRSRPTEDRLRIGHHCGFSGNRFEFSCGSQSANESVVIVGSLENGIDEELDLVFGRLVYAARPAFQEVFERYQARCLECWLRLRSIAAARSASRSKS